MSLEQIAEDIFNQDESAILIYAFNATGKTRLSVTYNRLASDKEVSGVYYNAFSEDLFTWDNDEGNLCLLVKPSRLNEWHAYINEETIRDRLKLYNVEFDFRFNYPDDYQKGIESITFFIDDPNSTEANDITEIKISRGEERIFVWCFFLALFQAEAGSGADLRPSLYDSGYFFIDDPVSSLDDHNIFTTAHIIFELIKSYCPEMKIILTTHHLGLYSILTTWLTKGSESARFKDFTCNKILSKMSGEMSLSTMKKDVFLFHLHILKTLIKAKNEDIINAHDFVLLRQLLENIASFLGKGQFSYVLQQIGVDNANMTANIINSLSHKNLYSYEGDFITPERKKFFIDILDKIEEKYGFYVG